MLKTSNFEKLLQKYAIYSPEEIKVAPIGHIFEGMKLQPLGKGLQARAYKIKDKDWVVKEGRWDLDLSLLFPEARVPFPALITQKIMKLFTFTFLPDVEEIQRQYKMYLTFVQYFGYFRKPRWYHHNSRDLIFTSQKHIRDSLLFYRDQLEAHHKIKLDDKIEKVLKSKFRYHNFLPKEYLLYGRSISPQNGRHLTYFIVQEFIRGKLLHDIPEDDMSDSTYYQLIILIYLILLMEMRDHLLPDTRPRQPLLQASNWLTKTDNIIVSKKRITFIDTRWFWDTKGNMVKKGVVISAQILRMAKFYINYLLEHVD